MVNRQSAPFYKWKRISSIPFSPAEIYQRLKGKKKYLLESTFQHGRKGKFSFIGKDPYMEITGMKKVTRMKDWINGRTEVYLEDALTVVKKILPEVQIKLPVPFYGGAVGYIGYDTVRRFERIGPELPDEIAMPDVHLMFFHQTIVIDHENEAMYIIAVNVNNDPEKKFENQFHDLLSAVLKGEKDIESGKATNVKFVPENSKEQFIEKVKTAKEYIRQGEVFQVVLSERFTADFNGNPFLIYQNLRKVNPSPYMFYIDFDDYVILGASPESLVQTRGKEVITNPIAGTCPRGKTELEDQRFEKQLLSDEKELAEHRMLVDLSRNDIGRVSESGSVEISVFMEVEKYRHVMHIVSEVKGRLKDGLTGIDALISCLPAGTVSGAPKIRAMQIINGLEEKKRGAYAGGIGYINFNSDINIALTIRSLVIKDGKAYLQAGAGIVYDSDPEAEYEEILNKVKSLTEVAAGAVAH